MRRYTKVSDWMLQITCMYIAIEKLVSFPDPTPSSLCRGGVWTETMKNMGSYIGAQEFWLNSSNFMFILFSVTCPGFEIIVVCVNTPHTPQDTVQSLILL